MTLKVFIGYDEREHRAAEVARKTLLEVTNGEIESTFLKPGQLQAQGLLTRLTDQRGGQDYDLASNAPCATRFAISRFLTPLLAQEGFALFVDCDVVFHEDPRQMLQETKAQHAVSVVQHSSVGHGQWKMVNQVQQTYPRKNWSSVMLFNCEHPANRRLSLRDVNERPGRDLHAFYWLNENEIGALDPRWNWLVGLQPEMMGGISHFTMGGPWIPGWVPAAHDDLWLAAERGRGG